jgi:hypothetical protein
MTRRVLLIALTIVTSLVPMAQPVRGDLALLGLWGVLLAYLIWFRKVRWLLRLTVAFGVSLVWQALAHDQYAYNQAFLVVAGVNLYPLLAWGAGLFAVYVIGHHMAALGGVRSLAARLAILCVTFWALLLTFEGLGYRVYGIRDLAVAQHPPLAAGCLRGPTWMKAAYLSLGPLFFALCLVVDRLNRRDSPVGSAAITSPAPLASFGPAHPANRA